MSELLVERHGPVETWTLNRPAVRNALDENLITLLGAAAASAEATDTEVVVLRGGGPSFCAGADLSLLSTYDSARGRTPRDHLTAIWDLTLAMERSAVTYVAVLHGHAIAGGLELALACDVVVASAGTLIGDGHVRQCLMPGGGASVRMERTLGRAAATWLALTGELLHAEAPSFASWLHAVTAPEDLDDAVAAIVQKLLAAPATARAAYKRLLDRTHGRLSPTDRDRELDAFDRHWLAHDVPQTLRAFLARNREAS
ncbi:enoyl-CoA hydratase/isomerase family protein [Actinomadura napierensis]|uniref:Enoyl-CoA hydratase/isomerase family protein n=1 Tax=Actinomadura napierensis TaxID=267854 RepID=A0ABP5KDF6_9ACTN